MTLIRVPLRIGVCGIGVYPFGVGMNIVKSIHTVQVADI